MMKVCSWFDVNKLAVKQVGRPAVYVSDGLQYTHHEDDAVWKVIMDSMKNIYGDDTPEFHDVMLGLIHSSMFFFETEEEQQRFYGVFEQELVYSSAVYACAYHTDGECMTENT